MTEIPFYLVAAFSDQPFAGNPAAVCLLKEWLPDALLLNMAQQHNQSETAFVVPESDGFALRWFTTRNEVNLCGHATLASAHVIFHHLDYPDAVIHFATASGRLTVSREGEWLTLDFPAGETQEGEPPAAMLSALGIDSYLHARKGRAWLIELASRDLLEALRPNITAMIPGEHKVTVTAAGSGEYDFVSRFLGKTRMLARQVSARGGDIRCELKGERVLMSGQAVTYLNGVITLREITSGEYEK